MIKGKLSSHMNNMGRERTLQERRVLLSDLHLCFSSPYRSSCITEQHTYPVFANPSLQVLNQSKASTASKQLSNFKIRLLLSSSQHRICVPKGPFYMSHAALYNLLLIIYKAECLQAAWDLSVGKSSISCHQREARTYYGHNKVLLPSGYLDNSTASIARCSS